MASSVQRRILTSWSRRRRRMQQRKPMSDWIAIDTAMLCLLMTSELTLPFREGTSLQQNRQLESNKGKSSIRSFVKNTTTVKSTMNMHIHTSWRHAKRIHPSSMHLSLGNNQRQNSKSYWSSVNAASTTGRSQVTTMNSMKTRMKQNQSHLLTSPELVHHCDTCMSLSISSSMSLSRLLVNHQKERSERALVKRTTWLPVLLQHYALLPEERPCKASSKTMFPCSESIGWTWKSVGDQRSYEQERPSLSMTKLCNLAAAPQMSVRYSRCTPVGLLKICHLVVSNPKAISTFVLSWLKQMLWV